MKINISDIVKTDGASLNVEFSETPEDLSSIADGFIFNNPVHFQGRLVNNSGIIRLEGILKTQYATRCYKCLRDIDDELKVNIKEDVLDGEKNTDSEAYTYEGNYIVIDKILRDNIVLNLPMKQACSEACKGLCPKCGADLNQGACSCKEDTINPQMEALKDFFKN